MDTNRPITPSGSSSHITDMPGIAKELHLQLQRYIEAQYPIRHRDVVAERHALLEEAGVISQEPFIESMPGYTLGPPYKELTLPTLLTDTLEELATLPSSLLPQRLYEHQAQALEMFLGQDRDLIVVTGTGSGKTETFLLPILLRSVMEAHTRPHSFRLPGMRALLLYPMNALVNDQLTRLRKLFGNGELGKLLRQQTDTKRSVRFGMYTSRTPYPGIMSKEKNTRQLLPLLDYYLQLEADPSSQFNELKQNGRWPALNLSTLRNTANDDKVTIGDDDYELYTRHQIQQWCPDILITNYSMLEYMLMRPIEQTIFQQTAEWLAQDRSNTLLIVLDEAHLYSGVTGAEIALLLRRLQARLGIHRERVRYILTSASLDIGEHGQRDIADFASTLVGTRSQTNTDFAIIEGKRSNPPSVQSKQSDPINEAAILADFNLAAFTNRAADLDAGHHALMLLAAKMNWPQPPESLEIAGYLGTQLPYLHVFQQLWKSTSEGAISFHTLATQLFPNEDEQKRSIPTSALLSLAAAASTSDDRPLLPVRAHLFFRGLPPLYACINPQCSARKVKIEEPSILGTLWLSPRLHCLCGARVYELYAHRNCGTLFLRAFPSGEMAEFYWHEPGKGPEKTIETLLLLGQPHSKTNEYEPVDLHVMTGRVFPTAKQFLTNQNHEQDFIRLYRPSSTTNTRKSKTQNNEIVVDADIQHWKSCPVCRKRLNNSITSLSTKGEQPFVNLVRRQFELQPPSTSFRETTPNMGRKILLFSDGRQRAARLARDLPREVELDTFRQALLLAVKQRSKQTGQSLVRMDQTLYSEFVGVCAQYYLYFFDGKPQEELLRQIEDLHNEYKMDIQEAIDDGWEPSISSQYRLALLRQIADPFYSMQRMCAAVVEARPASLKQLKRKPLFARLTDVQLRALVIIWIEELLEESAFDARIAPHDRENTVPGSGFAYTSAEWNDAEKAAETLLSYTRGELPLLRQSLVDEFCNTENERAFLNPDKLALRLTLEEPWHQCQDCARLIWLPLNNTCPNQRCGGAQLIQLPGDDLSLRARTDFYREPIRQAISGTRDPRHLTAEEHTAQLSYRDVQQVSTTTEEYELRFQDIGLSIQHPSIDILSCTTTMEVGIDIGALLGIGLRTMPPRRANYQQRSGRAGRRSAVLSTVLTYSENGSHDAHYFAHPEEMISGKLPCPQISPINERLTRRHIQAALIQTFFLEHIRKAGTMSNRQYGYLAEALGIANTFFATTGAASLTGFEKWLKDALEGSNPRLMPQISAWLPTRLGTKLLNEQEKRDFVREVAKLFIKQLYEVAKQFSPLISSKQGDDQAFATPGDERLLDLLFEHDFLPTYAFPREVRSFVIEKWKQERNGKPYIGIEQRPQQSVDIALSEYAPGRELIVDKATYRVGGIYVDPFLGATVATRVPSLFKHPLTIFALCMNCGYTLQLEATQPDSQEKQRCPLCNRILTIREILDPPGFAPEGARKLEPSQMHNDGTTRNRAATQVKLVLPQIDSDDFSLKTASKQVTWSKAEHRQLLIVNSGNDDDGFSVCRSCGTATSGDPSWLQKNHDRPFYIPSWVSAPKKCSAAEGIWRGYFGHLFHSDLLLLRLEWPQGVAYDLGAAWMHGAFDTLAQGLLLAATRLLDVSTSELQAGWSYSIAVQQNSIASISTEHAIYFFLFDTLSGGAGYATQIGLYVDRLLQETQHILDHCPEQCEQSCYRCLRTYHNRILHHRLDRHLAGTLLRAIVSGQIPETLSLADQRENLEMLRHYLDLSGIIECQSGEIIHGVEVPLLVKGTQQTLAIGVYPVQQDRQVVKHSLDVLSTNQVQLFSDYELAHNLPYIAHSLL